MDVQGKTRIPIVAGELPSPGHGLCHRGRRSGGETVWAELFSLPPGRHRVSWRKIVAFIVCSDGRPEGSPGARTLSETTPVK